MKDETFNIHGSWRLSFKGIVPLIAWKTKGAAEAQLTLLKKGYSVMTDSGVIKHIGFKVSA